MLQSKAKSIIKNNKFLYKTALGIQKFIPKKFVCHPDYFTVIDLLVQNESPDNESLVKKTIKKRLSSVLKETLLYVPYYRETIKIKPQDINDDNAFSCLQTFPHLNKKTIMDNKEAFRNKRFDLRALNYGTSGGSTGQGIGIWRSKREIDIENAFFDYEWGKIGFRRLNSRIVRFGTEAMRTYDQIPWEKRSNKLLISPYHLNRKWIEKIYDVIVRFKPEFFHTYPSCLESLAKYMVATNKPILCCKGLLLASEAFTMEQFLLFKRIFNATLSANYGLCERTNLAFMREYDNGEGFFYELNPIYGYSENKVDEYGNYEIVGTSYWNTVMPLIRYQTQDFGRIENGIIKQLDGRTQEFLITKDNGRIPGFSIKIDEFTWDYVDVYQIVQNNIGKIILQIVPKINFNNNIKDLILQKQKERWGSFFDIEIALVKEIPRTQAGKFRLIVNNLKI